MEIPKKLFSIIKNFIFNHKKKLIALSLLLVAYYAIKKRITIDNFIIIVQKIIRITQYLPLPQAPAYRNINQLSLDKKYPSSLFSEIKKLINIEAIKNKIKKKEYGEWQTMKENVLTGFGECISIFDVNQIIDLIYQKYQDQFRQLDSIDTFKESIKKIKEFYKDNLERTFEFIKSTIKINLDDLDVNKEYSKQQILNVFKTIFQAIFHQFYRVSGLQNFRKNKQLINKQVSRLFYTTLQKTNSRPSKVQKFFNWVWQNMKIPTLFKEVEYQITNQRFQIIRKLYSIDNKKINQIRSLYERHDSSQLFQLVWKQIQDMIQSLNFQSLVYYNSQYLCQKFINRLVIYMNRQGIQKQKLAKYLSLIYKICNQEFINEQCLISNQIFLQNQIKNAIILKVKADQSIITTTQIQTSKQTNLLLNQVEYLNRIQFAKNQFYLKYYYQRSGIEVQATNLGYKNQQMDRETKQLLNMLSNGGQRNQKLVADDKIL